MKKAISFILTLAIVLTLIPFGSFVASAAGTVFTEGAYTYDLLGTAPNLTANIKGYTGGDEVITIPVALGGYQVTSIGSDAFKGRMGIKSLTLPSALTLIGSNAFNGCTGLGGITIPDKVTSIGFNAFYGCTGLQNITFGTAVTTIGNSAFQGCTGISMLSIPDNVTSIGTGVFSGCTGIVKAVVGDGILNVGSNAFYGCTGMTAITFGSSVGNIDLTALQNCTGLTEIIVDENNLSYSSQGCVLFNKDQSILKQYLVNKTESYTIPGTVTKIGYKAFENWTRLTGISIPSSVLYIDNYAFAGCTALSTLSIGISVTSIGTSAFSGCSGITSLAISGSVISIGDNAFLNCIGLPDLIIPNNVTSIGTSSFSGCTKIVSVTIGRSVKTIGASAFSGCIALIFINIPDNVTSIGSKIFNGCTSLTAATIGNGVTGLYVDTFKGCTLLSVINIGFGVTFIDFNAFVGVASLVELNINENNQKYSSRDCVLFNKDKTELIHYLYCPPASYTVPDSVEKIGDSAFIGFKQISAITIADSVKSIGASAFSGCSGLIDLVIPNGVTMINEKTFFGCSGLVSISLPTALTSIGLSAFSGCSKLASILIPATVNTIYPSAFSDCKALKLISLPNTITSIAEKTFYQCTSLIAFTIPDSVTNIGVNAFSGCSSLTEMNISNNTTNIGTGAFSGCIKLPRIIIPDSVTIIGDSAFSGCIGLNKLLLGSQVTSIGASTFKGCTGLTRVVLPFTVSTIGTSAFQNCTKLSAAYFFGSAPKMGTLVFSGCAAGFKVYYLSTAEWFSNPWNTYTTEIFLPVTDITFSPSISAPTNGNVTLTINYLLDAYSEEYKVDGGDWTNYTLPLILTANCTVSARCKDSKGNITDSSTIVVSNIDKTPPIVPAFAANPITQTSGNVTVTITYPGDAAIKEYNVGNGIWTAYTLPVVLSSNNTIYARCTDSAGNVSAVSSLVVNNIYTVALPILAATPSTPTNGNVIVTITYPANATIRQYKVGSGAWAPYTTPVVLTANETVYAKCADSSGNISGTSTIVVSNIDRIAPATPELSASTSAPTNGSITVTIIYPADAAVKEYKLGSGVWTAYTASIVLAANNTVSARCADAAGNSSGTGSLVVSNIDKTPPATPTLGAAPSGPTNGNVTVTITFPADASVKEYKIGSGVWSLYTASLVLSVNGTVSARCTDNAGNISQTSSISISNIDKIAPVIPTLLASTAAPTTGNVTITISYPADAAVKEYKVGNGAWVAYPAPVALTANNTIYARCSDAVGNTSDIGSIVISNIYKLIIPAGSTAIISPANNLIFGLAMNLTQADFESKFINISGNVRLEYSPANGKLGTGTQVRLIDNITNNVLKTYTIVIYGDLNGDGNIDSIDAGNIIDHENYILNWNPTTDAALYKAGDLNGDGNVDSVDAGIAIDVENYLVSIDQRTGLATPR